MKRIATVASLLLLSCGTAGTGRSPSGAEPPAQPRPEVLVARARALRAEGDVEGARARLEAAVALAPASDEVRLELADLLLSDGEGSDRAAALLAGVARTDSARYHLLGARLAEARGDDAGAAAAYERALAIEPDPDARLRRALALERLGSVGEATTELERVRADRPGDALARAHLAERYEADGRISEAEAELRGLAEAQPDRAAGWERLARFYERAGRAAEARAALARARGLGGGDERGALRPLLPSRR